jgi:hypothetical protein
LLRWVESAAGMARSYGIACSQYRLFPLGRR